MFGILDIFLLLAFISTIAGTVATQQPSGPEGPIGVWLLLVFPCLFAAILLFLGAAKESLTVKPGGRLLRFVIATGILITFSLFIFAALDRHNNVIQGLLLAVPYLILAGCAVIIHRSDFPQPKLVQCLAAILLGGAALTGWGLAGSGIFLYIQKEVEHSALQAQKEREQNDQRELWEVTEYAKLENSPSLNALLQFTRSRNEQVRRKARVRVSSFPELDEKLIELLDRDSEDAVSYIANVYENPPARLAPAWGKMLERQLKKWDSLQYDEHAGTWEQNLINYFEGARKIQLAGGSLHTELLSWHKHLQKCRGLENLAHFVKNLL